MSHDEAVAAYRASRKLLYLYQAYRATSEARGIVLQRIRHGLKPKDPSLLSKSQQLVGHLALSRESTLAFSLRAEDIRKRLSRLRKGYPNS